MILYEEYIVKKPVVSKWLLPLVNNAVNSNFVFHHIEKLSLVFPLDKKTATPDGQKVADVTWEPLDMSEFENELQTAHTVQLELDYQRYTNRRTPSPVEEESRQTPTQEPLEKNLSTSSKSEENGRRIPLFYAPSSKTNDELSYNDEDVEKPFECRHCIISFSRLNDLQNHMELHSVKKPFSFSDIRHKFDESSNQLKSNHSIKALMRPSTSEVQF